MFGLGFLLSTKINIYLRLSLLWLWFSSLILLVNVPSIPLFLQAPWHSSCPLRLLLSVSLHLCSSQVSIYQKEEVLLISRASHQKPSSRAVRAHKHISADLRASASDAECSIFMCFVIYILGFTLNEWHLHCKEGMGRPYWHYTANEKVEKKNKFMLWEHKAGFVFNVWWDFSSILIPN